MTARELIVTADKIRKDQGLTQAEWSRASGMDDVGMAISRAYNKGNCKLTTIVQLLEPLGYELQIRKMEEIQ